ncbi:MAG: DNA repair protein RecO [FCB group bacterium]|nr:DNA repair protein RecO [FCB group bacterium]
MLISTESVVLKIIPYMDTSIIARIFTKDHGKVTLMAKGAKRPKSPFLGFLEPMSILNTHYYQKDTRDIQTLKEVSFAHSTYNIRSDLNKLCTGLAVIDIMDKTSMNDDPAPILYRLMKRVLEQLESDSGHDRLLFVFFLVQLAIQSGFKPNLYHCSLCGMEYSRGIFNRNTGDLHCSSCLRGGDIILNLNALKLLDSLIRTNINSLQSLNIDPTALKESLSFLPEFLLFHLDGMRRVRSLDIVNQLWS